jgi:hypothetical protein
MQLTGQSTHSLRQFLLAALVCCSCRAHGAVVEDLYIATVERQTDVSDSRAAEQTAALAEVLVRVTGSRLAPIAPELSPLLENPGRFVASFGYPTATEAQVTFLASEIERELAAEGWPVWGAERPQSVLWIAITDQFGEQAILTAGELPEDAMFSEHMLEMLAAVREEVETAAQLRGIPWLLPEFATLDDMRLRFDEVWAYSFGGLTDISSAWEADAIVIGRVRESVIGTDVEWLLQSDTRRESYPGAGVTDGIHWLADAFAQEYVTIGGPRMLTLRVTGVRDFESYARVLAYLESVTMLSDVNVESYSAGELLLRVVSRGDAPVLARTLSLDDVLREQNQFSGPGPGPGPAPIGSATTLNLVVVPERIPFDGFDSGF